MTLVVGLTGGIGSGKTTVAELFHRRGVETISADELARQAVVPGSTALQKIVDHFGKDVITTTGELDRGKLREKVFAAPREREWLEQLLHPEIEKLRQKQIRHSASAYMVVEIPLLVEKKLFDQVDRVLVVDLPEEEQIRRASQRDSDDNIRSIMAAQASRDERKVAADDLIDNSGDIEELEDQVEKLHHHYLQLAAQSDSADALR